MPSHLLPTDRSTRRLANVDLLRGVAALLVVWQHAAELFVSLPGIAAHGTAWFDVADLLGFGRAGVVAFFAISGFVIVPTVRGPRDDATRDFIVKRLLRLYPAYWASMVAALGTVWWLFDRPVTTTLVVANATMIPLEWGVPQILGQYWTLEVELIFYVFVVVLFRANALRREGVIAFVGIVLSIAWPVVSRSHWGKTFVEHNLVWPYLGYFLTVMWWGAMVRGRLVPASSTSEFVDRPARANWPFALLSALVFGRPLLGILFGSPTVNQEEWRGTLLGLLLFVVFVRVHPRRAAAFFGLGTISYSLYLFHPVVIYPLFLAASRESDRGFPLPVYVAPSIFLSIACAAVSYRSIEAPANRFARWVVGRLHDRRRSPEIRLT